MRNPLPREISPGVFWLGQCLHFPHDYKGNELHGYNSVYVVAGELHSVLIESGHPNDLPVIEQQLESLMARGVPAPKWVLTTHTETPHSGGVGRYLGRYPDMLAVGEVSDLHMTYPAYADRLRPMSAGESLDLGDTTIVIVEAVFRDFLYTRWAFDSERRILFTGDGFAYSHYHEAGQCGQVAEEVEALDIPDMTSLFAELAFKWTRYVDIEPYIDRLDRMLFEELNVTVVAPTHGLPITNPAQTMPAIREGLRLGSVSRSNDVLAGPQSARGAS